MNSKTLICPICDKPMSIFGCTNLDCGIEPVPLPTPAPVEEQEEWEKQATKDYNNGYESESSAIEKAVLSKEAEGKAKELAEKFYEVLLVDGSLNEKRICYGYAKQCAIIYCDGMIDESSDNIVTIGRGGLSNKEYWQQVRTAINQL